MFVGDLSLLSHRAATCCAAVPAGHYGAAFTAHVYRWTGGQVVSGCIHKYMSAQQRSRQQPPTLWACCRHAAQTGIKHRLLHGVQDTCSATRLSTGQPDCILLHAALCVDSPLSCRQQSQGLLPAGTAFDLFRGMAASARDEVETYPTQLAAKVTFGAKTHPEVRLVAGWLGLWSRAVFFFTTGAIAIAAAAGLCGDSCSLQTLTWHSAS